MNWYSIFYWLTVADGVKSVFDVISNIFTFLATISLIALVVVSAIHTDDTIKEPDLRSVKHWHQFVSKTFWLSTTICIITWLGYVATPTKKDCLLIVAGGAVGNFISTDSSAKKLPADVTNFLRLSLQSQIKELSEEARKEFVVQTGTTAGQTPKEKLLENVKDFSREQIIEYIKSDTLIK